MQRYSYHDDGEPTPVREVKWVLDFIAYWLLGKWLNWLQNLLPPFQFITRQVPNAMSIFRIPISPVVAWLLTSAVLRGDTSAAWTWLAAAIGLIILDGLDGPLARQLDAISDFGKAIDPAADKVLALSMSIGFLVLTQHFQGWGMFALLAFATGWAVWVEFKLVKIAASTKRMVDLLNEVTVVELPGANIYGKIKFSIQSVSLVVAFALMIALPLSAFSSTLLIVTMFVARWFADKSLGQHRRELWVFERQADKLDIMPAEQDSVWNRFVSRNNTAA
jgi:phosphatidylglycerophosphate synthase